MAFIALQPHENGLAGDSVTKSAALKRKPERLPPEDARQTSRLTVEQVSDGFGTRGRVMPMVEVLARRGTLTHRQARAGEDLRRVGSRHLRRP